MKNYTIYIKDYFIILMQNNQINFMAVNKFSITNGGKLLSKFAGDDRLLVEGFLHDFEDKVNIF